MAEKKPKKEEGAPAYMAQFTALMTILLAFFITMLTMGAEKQSEYKREGTGYIRNAFGATGGLGILPFVRSMMRGSPSVKGDENKDSYLQGYNKGIFSYEHFDAEGIIRAKIEDRGYVLKLKSGISFGEGESRLSAKACRELETAGRVFFNLKDYIITVCCIVATGNYANDRLLSSKRAYVVTRFFKEECNMPAGSVHGIGYAHDYYWDGKGDEQDNQSVFFLIRRRKL